MELTLYHLPQPEGPTPTKEWLDDVALSNEAEFETFGMSGFELDAEKLWHAALTARISRRRERIVAYENGIPVGCGRVTVDADQDPTDGQIYVYVRPAHRRRHIATRLYDELVELYPESVTHLTCEIITGPSSRNPISHGGGHVDGDHPNVRFLLSKGFSLALTERVQAGEVSRILAVADAQDRDRPLNPGYEVIVWDGPTPPELVSAVCEMLTALDSDVPSGDVESARGSWTEERLAGEEQSWVTGGFRQVSALARTANGVVVGYSDIVVNVDNPTLGQLAGTIVDREHRGQGIASYLKAAAIRHLHDISPETRTIITFNEWNNVPIIKANERLGYETRWHYGKFWKALRG